MTNIVDKVKDKLKGAKDTLTSSKDTEETGYDSTKQYETNEPMSPAKIKEHEPTAVKREITERTTDDIDRSSNLEEAKVKHQGAV